MKCDELTPIELECNMGKDINGVVHREPWKAYDIDEVDAAIAELKDVIHEQQVDLEGAKATAYADSVDAGMRERRLKRALYKACAMWADRTRLICSVFGSDAPKIRWERMYDKCRAKAEEYK